MNKITENKAITLIALVITIIVLLILAAVTLNIVIGENGIFGKARISKEKMKYESAKEIVDLKVLEVRADIVEKGGEFLDKFDKKINNDANINIEKYYYKESAVLRETGKVLNGIVVVVNNYPEYKFLIGDEGITGITTDSDINNMNIEEFDTIEQYEKKHNIESGKQINENQQENNSSSNEEQQEGGNSSSNEGQQEGGNSSSNEGQQQEVTTLPSQYKKVEYIQGSGSQWIDTKYTFTTSNTKVVVKFEDTTENGGRVLFGTGDDSTCGYNVLFGNIMYMGSGGVYTFSISSNVLYEMEVESKDDQKCICKLNGTVVYNNYYSSSINNALSMYILTQNPYTSRTRYSKIYNFKIYDNNILKRYLFPCYSTTTVTNADGVECEGGTIGLYDTVEGVFYTNQGTGTFSKGSDI